MKWIIIKLSLICILLCKAEAQELSYYNDIAPIIFANCTPCHNPQGAAPFNLLTYEDVAKRGEFIAYVTKIKYMPPWYADPLFREFKNQRILEQKEIKMIYEWVNSGMPKGDSAHFEGIKKVNDIVIDQPDTIFTMKGQYLIPNDLSEQYRFFVIPSGLKQRKYIKSIAFIPGNKKLVHHSRIMIDTSNLLRPINGMSEFDPKLNSYRRVPLADEFFYGWVPGNFRIEFPEHTGKLLHANSDFILNIHYAPNPLANQTDLSKVAVYYVDETVNQEVKTLALTEKNISNLPFKIPANTKKTFYMRSEVIEKDLYLISVLPHMHLLGKSFKAYAITKNGDAIQLIYIPEWNFNWQSTYQFKEYIKVPKGSVIYAEGNYDNTESNPENPFSPPKDIKYGWNTTDEMMNLIFYYVEELPLLND